MKKILLAAALILATMSANAAVLAFNTTTNGTYLVTTNRASVYNIEITAPSANAVAYTLKMYDAESLADPYFGTNYTSAAYVTRTLYATNLVTSYVGYNGYTNWYTNAGIYSLTSTNAAATNALPLTAAFTVAAGNYAVYTADALFSRGICVTANTNASVVIYYKPAQ